MINGLTLYSFIKNEACVCRNPLACIGLALPSEEVVEKVAQLAGTSKKIQEESFLDFMIKKLQTYEGKLEVISIITTSENLKFNINSQESAEIIEAFKELYKALIKINK